MIKKLALVRDLIAEGSIRLGVTCEELVAVLGPPDEEGGTSRKHKAPCVWKYGDVEFEFPPAKNQREARTHGLQLIYVDEFATGTEHIILLDSLLGGEA